MESLLALTDKEQKKVPDIKPGDTVRVHTKIVEGSKERVQVFEGVVLRVKGSGNAQSFTVRKLSYGIGVERTFLAQSPKLTKIEIKKRAKVRRAYLTYLRELRGKAAKLKDRRFDSLAVNTVEEDLKPEDLAPPTNNESVQSAEEIDAEITELTTEAEDTKEEISTEDIAQAEDKQAAEGDHVSEAELEDDHQEIQKEETDEGIEKAEADLEKGKDGEGAKVEKVSEDIAPEKE
jgi:large subunit ribosomal protein L19